MLKHIASLHFNLALNLQVADLAQRRQIPPGQIELVAIQVMNRQDSLFSIIEAAAMLARIAFVVTGYMLPWSFVRMAAAHAAPARRLFGGPGNVGPFFRVVV